MASGSELQVFKPVVSPVAVDVVDGLACGENSSQMFGHDKPMLNDVSVLLSHRMTRLPNMDVPMAVRLAAWSNTPPNKVRLWPSLRGFTS